ncbi:MAG: Holliday junction branch migration protein RuvA [Alphaproteobacteria bacterium]|jgi:Holliday junction DNA helicase RuvA|nr:Holliday junction branch migration protein RuvA [Alphaproteobacteria bacterium]MDP6564306.1 Holliday junction branch migration protein RuvA [Alphaproteobacteria bacterium]
MIAKLSGLLDGVGEGACVVDVGGVGYLVYCSGRTLAAMPTVGEAVGLLIETHVREDHIHLYGFAEAAERDWFKLLLGVQGVGARVALGILSTLTPGELVQAVVAQDKTMLTRAPSIGPKLGGRIVAELKDKVSNLALGPGATAGATAPPGAAIGGLPVDAISALVNLGYRQGEAHQAVHSAVAELGGEAGLQDVIRNSLRTLAR